MKTNEHPAAVATKQNAAEPKNETSEVRKASFWVSQLCVIIATVLGVYLAATQGFKQAVAFENVISDKNNAAMRISLRNEMAQNTKIVRDYVAKVTKDGSLAARKRALPLQMFVWESMKFSPATLETPPEFLAANAEFIRVINYLHGELGNSGISTANGLKRMEDAVKKLEEEIFPKMDADVSELRASLKKHDIEI